MSIVNTCGLTRLLVPALLMGFAVSSATGNEALAWLAAGLAALAAHLIGRIGTAPATCPVPVSTRRSGRSGSHPSTPDR